MVLKDVRSLLENLIVEANKIVEALKPTIESYDKLSEKYPKIKSLTVLSTLIKRSFNDFINELNGTLAVAIKRLDTYNDKLEEQKHEPKNSEATEDETKGKSDKKD